jgi:hypothetical protein
MLRFMTVVVLTGLVAGQTGCDPYEVRLPVTGATLEGTVRYGNEPVPLALIVVMGESGSATGMVEQGRYKVENVPLGPVRIGVNTEAARGQFISQQMAQSYKGPGSKGGGSPPPRFLSVPSKYAEPENSGLTTTIQKGPNTFDIVLPR